MASNLSFDDLKAAAEAGTIDTVLVAAVDMQGRLMGKRFHVPTSSRAATRRRIAATTCSPPTSRWRCPTAMPRPAGRQGYGDYVMKPDLSTLRPLPWLEGTALVLCDLLDHHDHSRCRTRRARC